MPGNNKREPREVSPWILIALSAIGLVLLVYFGWQAISGREGDPGPPKKVYPGMYDLRKEAQSHATKGQGASQNGP